MAAVFTPPPKAGAVNPNKPAPGSGGAGLPGTGPAPAPPPAPKAPAPPKPTAVKAAPKPAVVPAAKAAKPGQPAGATMAENTNPLYNPNVTLSGANLEQAADAIANSQVQGPLAELAAQKAQNVKQGAAAQGLTMGYFSQLYDQAKAAYDKTQGIGSGLNSQLQGISNDTQGQLSQFGQQAQGGAMADLQAQGLGGGGYGMLAQQLAQQKGVAAQNAQTYRDFGASQGANYSSAAASQLGTNALRGQERIANIAQGTNLLNFPLSSKQASLIASKGAIEATAAGKLRQQEITNQIARQGLGLKAQSLQATIAQNAAKNALTTRGQNITLSGQQATQMRSDRQFQLDQQKVGDAAAKDKYLRDHGLGPYKPAASGGGKAPLSASSQQKFFGQIDKFRGLLQQLTKQGVSPADAWHWMHNGGTYTLPNGKSTPPLAPAGNDQFLNAAYNLNYNGGLSPGDVNSLKGIGLVLGNRYPTGYHAPSTAGGGIGGGGVWSGF